MKKINVTIWNEFRHEKENPAVREIYPDGIHTALKNGLAADDLEIRCAWLDQPGNGLPPEILENTDVLIWWGHRAHHEVDDETVKNVHDRILAGMGLIVLHSGHFAKIFQRCTGTSCTLKWREAGERTILWNLAPDHPITRGIGDYFELAHEEMYGEKFDIPEDGKVIFASWFEGGNVFRSGVTFERGRGRIFYFQPGHETYRNYYDRNVLLVIGNAIRWAAPELIQAPQAPGYPPLHEINQL
ncbi:MAG: trehalose utilization protein ThuA [Lentisphaerae bacterium]|nr:trehalose utilization protein ThuA [Lentisphaerota bacterium]